MSLNQNYYHKRYIRVFFSSTFKEVNVEQDYLLMNVIPKLRKLCRDRSLTLSEIDLRFGECGEESKNSSTIELCLKIIANFLSNPSLFIGFLSERYGWVPKHEELNFFWKIARIFPTPIVFIVPLKKAYRILNWK